MFPFDDVIMDKDPVFANKGKQFSRAVRWQDGHISDTMHSQFVFTRCKLNSKYIPSNMHTVLIINNDSEVIMLSSCVFVYLRSNPERYRQNRSLTDHNNKKNHEYIIQWRHNGRDGDSNYQPHDCLLNRLFKCRSKKTPKLRVTGLCVGNSPVTDEFPAQRASNTENVSIWWRHHDCDMNHIAKHEFLRYIHSKKLQARSQPSIIYCYHHCRASLLTVLTLFVFWRGIRRMTGPHARRIFIQITPVLFIRLRVSGYVIRNKKCLVFISRCRVDTGYSTSPGIKCLDKQRVLMHRHQGWNVRHGLCHIYMRYLYIYELFIAFVCFVVCSLL